MRYSVPVTILTTIVIEAPDKATARAEAQRFAELSGPEDGFVDGWNDVQRQKGAPLIVEAMGHDVERIELDEIEIVEPE